jgi:hypothetical protein
MRGYAFLETAVAVSSDAAPVVRWLEEFLVPAFAPWTGSAPDFVVRIRTDPIAHRAVAGARPAGTLVELPCFALDGEVVRLPAWTIGERTVLADAKRGAHYVLAGTGVEVLAEPEAPAFRAGVMRVVREIVTARALADARRLQLHAAALEVGTRDVVIAGPKGCGKTTLLAYVALSTGARIVTNDRLFVSEDAHGFTARGMPTIVSLRPETLALLPRLVRGVPAGGRIAHLTLAEAAEALTARGNALAGERLKLSPAQLARQAGVELAAGGRVAAVVFPVVDRDPDGFAVERLSATEGAARLRDARFGLRSGKGEPTAFERLTDAHRPADADGAAIERLAGRVSCFAVRIGARRYREPAAAETILASVLPGGAGG